MSDILIAPNSFKGSLTAIEFCEIAKQLIDESYPNVNAYYRPLSDGGDGFLDCINYSNKYIINETEVMNPLGEYIPCSYLINKSKDKAIIELALSSGMNLINKDKLDVMKATTFGTGEIIKEIIELGIKKIIIGIGGSATNDAGIGILQALGFKCLDVLGNNVKLGASSLNDLYTIIPSKELWYTQNLIDIEVACDVTNPLFGKNGAAYIYAAQKGASNDDIVTLDNGLVNFSKIVNRTFNISIDCIEGGGAAGGTGACLMGCLNAKLTKGFDLIKKESKLNEILDNNIDLVITGEGSTDMQSLCGKLPIALATYFKSLKQEVVLITGCCSIEKDILLKYGISKSYELLDYSTCKEDSISNAHVYLKRVLIDLLNNQFSK